MYTYVGDSSRHGGVNLAFLTTEVEQPLLVLNQNSQFEAILQFSTVCYQMLLLEMGKAIIFLTLGLLQMKCSALDG